MFRPYYWAIAMSSKNVGLDCLLLLPRRSRLPSSTTFLPIVILVLMVVVGEVTADWSSAAGSQAMTLEERSSRARVCKGEVTFSESTLGMSYTDATESVEAMPLLCELCRLI
jgi:hypothetical protein